MGNTRSPYWETPKPVAVSSDTYLDQEVIVGNDASQDADLPAGTTFAWVTANGGPAYVSINGEASADSSGTYVPDGQTRLVGPYNNITSLGVFVSSGKKAHLVYGK